ncbi:MAG: sigma-70 family RNA polymerase sigma factor [Chitinophagaceae bacterium]|nr:sigma-70 family RNA polymerase sigma factor [Chitinophagaceae bacterium]
MLDQETIQQEKLSFVNKRQICDEVVWIDFKNGDRSAFALLYLRYYKILIHTGTGICDDKDLILDCIQDLFVELWKNKSGLGQPQSVKAYLTRSLQRKILRQLKRIRSGLYHCQVETVPDTQTVQCVELKMIAEQFGKEQKSQVRKAITLLTRRQKEAVYLRFYANLSYAEIAGKMSISTDSIYNLISKAMGNMQQELGKIPVRTL